MKLRLLLSVALALLASGFVADDALATHFRGGQITYVKTGPSTVEFTVIGAYRRSFFSPLPSVGPPPSTFQPGEQLDFGDGTTTGPLTYTTAEVYPGIDEVVGRAQVSHTYSGPGPYAPTVAGCCTSSDLLLNANDKSYRFATRVDLGDDESPRTQYISVYLARGQSGFSFPASDAGAEPLTVRWATPSEVANPSSTTPGPPETHPAGFSLLPNVRKVSIDWSSPSVAADGRYFTSFVVEALDPLGMVLSSTQTVFLVNILPPLAGSTNPPVFDPPTPADGSEYTVAPGQTQTIDVAASDSDAGETVHLIQSGLPANATFTATDGNPASGTLDFTPNAGQDGQDFIVSVGARDSASSPRTTSRSYLLRVRTPPDTDGDGVPDASDACPSGSSSGADTDGDGCKDAGEDSNDDDDALADDADQCDLIAAATASGCPAAARTLTLSYSSRKKTFKGRLSSDDEASCAAAQEVTILRKVSGDDKEIGTPTTDGDGKYKLAKRARRGKYYSTVDADVIADLAECQPAASPIKRVG